MTSAPIPFTQKERWPRPGRRKLALLANCIWPLIVWIAWDHWLLDGFDLRLFGSLLFFFVVSFELRCGWAPFAVIAGAILGLVSDATVKGGTHESMMWETVRHIAGATAIGLIVGLVLDSIPRTRRILQQHMR